MSDSERPANLPGLSDITADGPDTGATSHDQILPESYRSCLDAIPDLMALKGGRTGVPLRQQGVL